MISRERITKALKEILLFVLLLTVALNVMSYLRAPELASQTIPDFSAMTLSGELFNTTRHNRPLLIHFWATWCPTCKLEAANIERISRYYDVVSIAVKSGDKSEVQSYMQRHDLHFKTINDPDGTLARRFNIPAYPTTFIYDAAGTLGFSEVGYTSTLGLLLRLWWVQ